MIKKTNSTGRVFNPKNLRKHPYVQAAAVASVARTLVHDIDREEDADTPQVPWEVVFKKVGLSEGDPREALVADTINKLSDEMEAVLVKKVLLDKNCARKYQQQRAA